VDIRKITGKKVDLDKAAKELGVCKESLTKYNRSMLEEWANKPKVKSNATTS